DKTVRVWDAKTDEALGSPLQGHASSVCSVAILPDGRCVVSGSDGKTIWVWNMEAGEALSAPLQGHTGRVLSVIILSEGNRIVSGLSDQTIRV
ncbi:WD40 repeat-like protein, partial [Suillus weaverae]